MIEPRIYRAAFLPAIVAVLLVAFSFQTRPPALEQGLPGDVLFDAEATTAEAQELAEVAPICDLGRSLAGRRRHRPRQRGRAPRRPVAPPDPRHRRA
jgi:hypothetical protein